MPRLDQIRVFVASPSDVLDARKVLEEVVEDLNQNWERHSGLTLQLLDWRKHVTPWLGKPPEPTILQQLPVESWDLFVGIMWSRLGTPTGGINPATGEPFQSGTEEEFTLAYKCNQQRGFPQILFYRCMKQVIPDVDTDQLKLVQRFFKQFEQPGHLYFGLYTKYESLDELRRHATRHLTDALFAFQNRVVSPPTSAKGIVSGLSQWLEKVGLSGNPFTHWDAGTDDNLPKYFHVAVPYFDELMGNSPDVPQCSVVFGKHGAGKTALCRMIEHYSRHRPGNREVLALPYTDFSALAEKINAGDTISPRDHTEQILISGMKALSRAVDEGSVRVGHAIALESRLEFMKYLRHFGRSLGEPQWKAITEVLGMQSGDDAGWELTLPDSYVEIFYGFCRTVRIFGYDIVYVLVDQLDESSLADTDEKALSLLIPLMADLKLMEPPEGLAAFRFFLPSRFEEPLKSHKRIRLGDRLKPYTLAWTPSDLQIIIEQRLYFFSIDKARPYSRLAELSEVDDLDDQLIKAAQQNPRTLITLCDYIISEHCRMPITDDTLQLTQVDLEKALRKWTDSRTDESDMRQPSTSMIRLQPEAATALGARGLPPYSLIDFLPTPIAALAARYRDEQNATEKLWRAFRLIQAILQFVVCNLLALYKHSGQADLDLDEKLSALLFTAERPASLGDWRQAMDRILKIKGEINSRLLEPFMKFRQNKEVGTCLSRLVEARNEAAHGRLGIPDIRKLREIDECVDKLLMVLEPISQIQLVSIEDYDVNDAGQVIHNVWLHRGNVLVPEKRGIIFERPYQRGRVVSYGPQSQTSIDLWPFILFEASYENLATSIEPELYFYEKVVDPQHSQKLEVQYTSPASGKTFRSSRVLQFFTSVGLIRS